MLYSIGKGSMGSCFSFLSTFSYFCRCCFLNSSSSLLLWVLLCLKNHYLHDFVDIKDVYIYLNISLDLALFCSFSRECVKAYYVPPLPHKNSYYSVDNQLFWLISWNRYHFSFNGKNRDACPLIRVDHFQNQVFSFKGISGIAMVLLKNKPCLIFDFVLPQYSIVHLCQTCFMNWTTSLWKVWSLLLPPPKKKGGGCTFFYLKSLTEEACLLLGGKMLFRSIYSLLGC